MRSWPSKERLYDRVPLALPVFFARRSRTGRASGTRHCVTLLGRREAVSRPMGPLFAH